LTTLRRLPPSKGGWLALAPASHAIERVNPTPELNGVSALNSSIAEFPAAKALGAAVVPGDPKSAAAYTAAVQELNLFYQLSGSGLRGHLAREYFEEDQFGMGASYVVSAEPGSMLDQLIINFEAAYVPDRTFTNPSLSRDYVRKPEVTTALVMEKYQRFFQSFPATYLVFQWMHKTQSDLFGRYLGGMGGSESQAAPGYGGGWNALAFAFQQPFPNLVWRFDFAALYDTKGGILVQPAVRWKPSGAITVEAFYNYLNGKIGGSNSNNNIIGTLNFADELGVRIGYQF
jgi:hypothetical protein